ncbi:MAG: hypothetical protein IT386_09660 [Deltaproteobacteria bacterium]|nr:hypothetical protein [Deltaproteobacteria bacterium]
MTRAKRAGILLAGALLLLAVQGCKWFEITVRIPDFDSRRVQGVWMWRKDPATGRFERAGQIVFQQAAASSTPGVEELQYLVVQPEGAAFPLRAAVDRDKTTPDRVTVRLWYARYLDPGEYRVSTYNDSGESPLSTQGLDLL